MTPRRLISVFALLILGLPTAARALDPDTSLTDASASFWGETLEDRAGLAVAAVGDVNGDGLADFLIGASGNDQTGISAGKTYLILGGGALVSDMSLALADASFLGEDPSDFSGQTLAGAGDVNGDGYADFLISAIGNDEAGADAGQAYLVLGAAAGWLPDVGLELADASFLGVAADDEAGTSLSGGGDVDGDGYDDLLIGAPGNADGGAEAGQTYLILGGAAGWFMDVDLATADGSFVGEAAQDRSGYSVAIAGDVNGDGYDDVLIGALDNDAGGAEAGQSYLLFGGAGGWALGTDLATADASFWGESVADNAGTVVAAAGDVDGDGYDDFLISAPRSDAALPDAGQVYLMRGRATGWIQDIHLSVADASYWGETAGDLAGTAVAAAGDVNGDGYDDLLVGAPYNEEPGWQEAGQAYVVLGSESLSVGVSLGDADASFWAESQWSKAGMALAGLGDTDGDGYSDLLVAAPFNAEAAIAAGQTYVIYGEAPPCTDVDGDGYGSPGTPNCAAGADEDCDDADAAIYPGAAEDPCDGIDSDCDGTVDELGDADGDGFSPCQGDCDDADAFAYPGASEICDGVDNNCNGSMPPGEYDEDLDGQMVCEGDCDDTDPDVFDGASEVCDGVDNNCDGAVLDGETEDLDADGWMGCADCDDTDAALNHDDLDGDGYSTCDDDCNDLNPLLTPEDADGDGYSFCDGDCNDQLADLNPEDADGDGYSSCDDDCDDDDPFLNPIDSDADGFSSCQGDCADNEPAAHPMAIEDCGDGIDNDCDGLVDFVDADHDDFSACDGEDCDDDRYDINPDADEECEDGLDNNCDGLVDEEDPECAGDDDDTVGDDDDDDDDTVGDDDDDDTVGDDDDSAVGDDDDTTAGDDDDTTAGDDDDSAPSGDDDADGGCECSAAGGSSHGSAALFALMALGLLCRRR